VLATLLCPGYDWRVGYRDDLVASQARAASLEKQLAEAKHEIERLKTEPEPDKPRGRPAPAAARNRKLGKIYFNPPRTYVPLLRLWWAGVVGSWGAAPSYRSRDTNNLVVWLLQRVLLWPVVNLVWSPVYYILLIAALAPVSFAVSLAITLAAFPLLLLLRVRLGDPARDPPGAGWPPATYEMSAGRLYLWILMSCCMQPLLVPMMPVLDTD